MRPWAFCWCVHSIERIILGYIPSPRCDQKDPMGHGMRMGQSCSHFCEGWETPIEVSPSWFYQQTKSLPVVDFFKEKLRNKITLTWGWAGVLSMASIGETKRRRAVLRSLSIPCIASDSQGLRGSFQSVVCVGTHTEKNEWMNKETFFYTGSHRVILSVGRIYRLSKQK